MKGSYRFYTVSRDIDRARAYQSTDIPGWTIIGVVTRGISDTGALVRHNTNGRYASANAGVIRILNQEHITDALDHIF